jgi:predicted ferric reductase
MTDIDHTYWYLTRASGLVAYVLLFASASFGLAMTGDLMPRWLQRFRVYDLHRFLALVTLGVTVFHIVIVLPDKFIGFSVAEILVPFASPYEPLYMALGVFAFYVSVIVTGAFYIRPRVSYRVWRLVHYATFVAFAMALVHGVGAGTDTEAGWVRYLYAATGLVVFNLTVYRALRGSTRGIVKPRAEQGASVSSLETGGRGV